MFHWKFWRSPVAGGLVWLTSETKWHPMHKCLGVSRGVCVCVRKGESGHERLMCSHEFSTVHVHNCLGSCRCLHEGQRKGVNSFLSTSCTVNTDTAVCWCTKGSYWKASIHKVMCDWGWEWKQHRARGEGGKASVRKEADGWRVVTGETSYREEAGLESDWNLSITNDVSPWVCSSMNSDWQTAQLFHNPTHTHTSQL